MSESIGRARSARSLRDEFDSMFKVAPRELRRDEVALLAVRAGADAFAFRVLETAGLLHLKKVVPVPSRRPELLGLAGLRGAVMPVYSLARLLGREESAGPPRWMVLAGAADRVALAFTELEGHLLVPDVRLRPAPSRHVAGDHVAEIAELASGPRPVLGVPSLLRAITMR